MRKNTGAALEGREGVERALGRRARAERGRPNRILRLIFPRAAAEGGLNAEEIGDAMKGIDRAAPGDRGQNSTSPILPMPHSNRGSPVLEMTEGKPKLWMGLASFPSLDKPTLAATSGN